MAGSIWDRPVTAGDTAVDSFEEHGVTAAGPRSVPQVDPMNHAAGLQGGRGLLDAHGRGVYNGVPLGETRQQEEAALETQYALRPAMLSRLRGATRKALGR